jgi:cyclopropane fatty-acyl-phospholipid synthase-like methyltransferase
MKFDKDISLIQQKMSETSIGIARRQNILKELNIEGGQTIIDVGCGGGPTGGSNFFGSRS